MAQASRPQRVKVFISYSRRDLAFAERLVAALEARGVETLIDKRDLPLAEEWQRELLRFIQQADAVAFVMSPASIGSKWCAWEVEQVQKLSKRLAPIVAAEVEDARVPEAVRKINYVFFTGQHAEGPGYESRCDALAAALKTDLDWVKDHTRIGALARRWADRSRASALLLRAGELEQAEAWRARQPPEAPGLTPVHREYIAASRLAATQRLRALVTASLAGIVIAASLAGFAWWQRQQALAENRRFETFFDLMSSEGTFSVEAIRTESNVDGPTGVAERALAAGRNLARRDSGDVRILWVDDNPDTNADAKQRFRRAMGRIGVSFIDAASVSEAERHLADTARVDLVISDVKHDSDRPGETLAGFRVLEHLRALSPSSPLPLIFYSGSFTREQADAGKCRGAVAQTRSVSALFAWALIALDEGRQYVASAEMRAYCAAEARAAGTSPAPGGRPQALPKPQARP